ncbi:hypothetical protein BH10PSE2_BH10PSE2_30340 [soil metagenome]
MNQPEAHAAFRHPVMLIWLMVGGFAGFAWRELFDLASLVF